MVELIAFVLEYSRLGEYGKAMGKALRDKELAMVVLGEFDSDMLSERGTALADIDCHIEHGTPDAAHQLALGEGRTLEMQSAHDAIAGHAFVVLYEGDGAYLLVELPL